MEEKLKKLPKLDAFCISIGNQPKTVGNEELEKFPEKETDDYDSEKAPESEVDSRQENELHDKTEICQKESRQHSGGTHYELELKTDPEPEFSVNIIFNSDRELHPSEISDDLEKTIGKRSLEPSRPKSPFPKNADNRSFSEKHYFVLTKTNQKIERFWLCYSKKNDAVYCEPCWLFADRCDPHFHLAWCEATINDWQGTSLLSSLPLLLDQSHLTDVTLSAGGKTLRAHRVVLSACSSFFSELFRTLDSIFHPVIVIPGASFSTVVALLTFMYSGEVNVFEEQIAPLVELAETLGIKGLADFHTSSINVPKPEINDKLKKEESTSTNLPTSLENLFINSLQLYPDFIPQPLNFSQAALNKTSELIAKYQQCNFLQHTEKNKESSVLDITSTIRSNQPGVRKFKELKKIDKVVEHLRSATSLKSCLRVTTPKVRIDSPLSPPSSLTLKTPRLPNEYSPNDEMSKGTDRVGTPKQPPLTYSSQENLSPSESFIEKTISAAGTSKTQNAKLYATCFICHKQLSNQYNLRVHLETHQNVRYACSVCSHVSRSKDALRKHVSYRHPGAPSPCESESRRKRTKTLSSPFHLMKQEANDNPQTNLAPCSPSQQYIFVQNKLNLQSPILPSNSTQISPGTSYINEIASLNKESTISDEINDDV